MYNIIIPGVRELATGGIEHDTSVSVDSDILSEVLVGESEDKQTASG